MLNGASLSALSRIAERANDLLNAYTPGFRPTFSDVTAALPKPEKSSNPLSVVAPADGWFVVAAKDGSRRYTRDGEFEFRNGALVTSHGEPVMTLERGVAVPLRADPVDVALGRCTDVRVESDGTLAYTRPALDPQTGERTVERVGIGRVALARFPAGTQPVRLDPSTYGAPHGVLPHFGTPADGSFGGLVTYARDRGALDLDSGIARLQEAYQAFSALGAANRARGKTESVAMDLVK